MKNQREEKERGGHKNSKSQGKLESEKGRELTNDTKAVKAESVLEAEGEITSH